ncbi:MAG: hypothetical protein EBR82_72450 [Caulobacteraceae bacterium]|nr:hypothetical protein [Caulobacteraceae bacterium]
MKHIPIAVAVVLVVLSFLPGRQPAAGPVAEALRTATPSDRAKVARIYTALAVITQRDAGKQIPTVGVWRAVHSAELRLAVGELKGKYTGLDVAVDKVLQSFVPAQDVPMSDDVIDGLVAACEEVAKQSG